MQLMKMKGSLLQISILLTTFIQKNSLLLYTKLSNQSKKNTRQIETELEMKPQQTTYNQVQLQSTPS